MSLSTLPAPVQRLLLAVRQGDAAAARGVLADGAVLTDGGRRYRGTAVRTWFERRMAEGRDRPIHEFSAGGGLVVTMFCTTRCSSMQPPAREDDWTFTVENGRISALSISRRQVPAVPPPIEAFVVAVNRLDLEAIVATFADDALVNDQLTEHCGTAAIRRWVGRDIVGLELALYVVGVVERNENATLTAHVSGDFDMRGLPDPLLLTFYFSAPGDRILQLIILRRMDEL